MCRCRAFLQHRFSFVFRLFHNSPPPNALFLFSCSCSCFSTHKFVVKSFQVPSSFKGNFVTCLDTLPAAAPLLPTPVMSPRPFQPEYLSLNLNSLPSWFVPPVSPCTLCDAPVKHQVVSSLCPNRGLGQASSVIRNTVAVERSYVRTKRVPSGCRKSKQKEANKRRRKRTIKTVLCSALNQCHFFVAFFSCCTPVHSRTSSERPHVLFHRNYKPQPNWFLSYCSATSFIAARVLA